VQGDDGTLIVMIFKMETDFHKVGNNKIAIHFIHRNERKGTPVKFL